MLRRLLIKVVLFSACVALLPQPIQAQSQLRINGTVVGISGRLAGRTLPFSLLVDQYTSGGQLSELNEALQRGEEELLRRLSGMRAGRIQIGGGVGVPANAIFATPWENGTRLTVLYERNINFFEFRYGRRSSDYRFGYAEIFLRQNGRGEGTLIPAARVKLRGGNTWEVEDFGVFPARLMGLRAYGQVMPR